MCMQYSRLFFYFPCYGSNFDRQCNTGWISRRWISWTLKSIEHNSGTIQKKKNWIWRSYYHFFFLRPFWHLHIYYMDRIVQCWYETTPPQHRFAHFSKKGYYVFTQLVHTRTHIQIWVLIFYKILLMCWTI